MKIKRTLLTITSLLLTYLLAACGPQPERVTFTAPAIASSTSWQQEIEKGQKVFFKTFLTGTVTVPTSGMLDKNNPKTATKTEDSMVVEVYSHWIRHPTKGDFLIDTGLNGHYGENPQGDMGGLIASFIVENSTQTEGTDIASYVKANKLDVSGIFLTHTHPDHSSGIPEIANDALVYVGKNEPIDYYPLILTTPYFDQVETLVELDFDRAQALTPFEKVIDVFGDGSLWAIATPGHSAGHTSYIVNSLEGPVLLTGDASHTRWGFENNVIPGWADDETLAQDSLERLRLWAEQNEEARVIFGHER